MKTNQTIHAIHIRKLKHLKNVTIQLDDKPVTAIMGPNCSGKTTILQILACCYQPEDEKGENHKFSEYFTPSTYEKWNSSNFELEYSYTLEQESYPNQKVRFKKDKRWIPKYDRRPARPVYYLEIKTAVPLIENETQVSNINFTEVKNEDSIYSRIIGNMSEVFNKRYSDVFDIKRHGKTHKAVKAGVLKYSELTMGAGEQRVFKILETLYVAPKYSLILIDEIDLLLHQYALEKLLVLISQIVVSKKQQLVFTTHNHNVLRLKSIIKVLHIHNLSDQTLVLKDTNIDALYRLSGYAKDLKKFEIYVEDEVSKKVVENLILESQIKKHVSIYSYGAAINAYTIAAGILLKDKNLENKYFILDGDVECSEDAIERNIKRVMTGDKEPHVSYRSILKKRIIKYQTINSMSPEFYMSELIKEIPSELLDEAGQTISRVERVADKHKYVDDIMNELEVSKEQAVSLLISNAQKNEEKWIAYTSDLTKCVEEMLLTIKQEMA